MALSQLKFALKKVLEMRPVLKEAVFSHKSAVLARKIFFEMFSPNFNYRLNQVVVENRILKVFSQSSLICQEIHFREKEIIKKINEQLNQEFLKKVVCQVAPKKRA